MSFLVVGQYFQAPSSQKLFLFPNSLLGSAALFSYSFFLLQSFLKLNPVCIYSVNRYNRLLYQNTPYCPYMDRPSPVGLLSEMSLSKILQILQRRKKKKKKKQVTIFFMSCARDFGKMQHHLDLFVPFCLHLASCMGSRSEC